MPYLVLMVITRTNPFVPAWVFGVRWGIHSFIFPKSASQELGLAHVPSWHTYHLLRRPMDCWEQKQSGIACKGWPMRKCPGFKTFMPSSLLAGMIPNGRLLRQASVWVRMVDISSNSSLEFPITSVRWVLKLLTVASLKPPKCGARSGMKCQSIAWLEQNPLL